MKDIIIIPDVHGRDFWREAVLNNLDKKIIFTGDYLDPYPYEGIEPETAFEMLKEIVALKEEHPNNIVLLLGNHDCSYMYSKDVCDCRRDKMRYTEIQNFLREKHKLFDIAYEIVVNDKKYVFSHAGIIEKWINLTDMDKEKMNVVDWLNNKNQESLSDESPETTDFCYLLAEYDNYRGWGGMYGSPVWNDFRTVYCDGLLLYPQDAYHVFGHTQLQVDGVFKEHWACLDCHKAFVLHEDGTITLYKTNDNIT